MGDKLMKYYQWAAEQGGLQAKIKLAQETKMPSTSAALAPDDAATIARFREVLRKLVNAEPPTY